MKNSMFLVFILSLVMACTENQSSENQTKKAKEESISAEDGMLWAESQKYFQAISGNAEKPENPCTPEKVSLGKMLYFDTRLSKTGNNSCNSCHNLATYGVDNLSFSKGDAGKNGGRNSPSVYNAALHNFQFWDGRAKDVEEQAGMPILNPVEMAIPSKEFLVSRLKQTKEYPGLFASAFPKDANPLTYENLQKAIGAFERTLVTPSKFDDYIGKNPSYLNNEEKQGLKLFIETGCTNCHSGVAIGGSQFQKFGVFGDYAMHTGSKNHDNGRMDLTKKPSDKDVFKVPSLRNVAKTSPYFHDGSVQDLGQAIQIMAKTQLNKDLNKEEIRKIEVFLNALTGNLPKI